MISVKIDSIVKCEPITYTKQTARMTRKEMRKVYQFRKKGNSCKVIKENDDGCCLQTDAIFLNGQPVFGVYNKLFKIGHGRQRFS